MTDPPFLEQMDCRSIRLREHRDLSESRYTLVPEPTAPAREICSFCSCQHNGIMMAFELYTQPLHSVLLLHLPHYLCHHHSHLRRARSHPRLLLDLDLFLLSFRSKFESLDAYLSALGHLNPRVVQPKFSALCALALFRS